MGKIVNEMTAEQVSNALLAQLLPEVSVGGKWKWYSSDTQEYNQICNILNKNADVTKYGLHYNMFADGILLYAGLDKILSVIDAMSYSQTVERMHLLTNWNRVQGAEREQFDKYLVNNLVGIGSRIVFGTYLSGCAGKYGVIENKEYPLFKLDIERVFAHLYNFYLKHDKQVMYLVGFDGKRKCLSGAFDRCTELRKSKNSENMQKHIDALARSALFSGLKAIYSGNALMCCIEL